MPRAPVALAVVLACLAVPLAPATTSAPEPATFLVGFGIRDITPTPALAQDENGNVNLGGFGFGCCRRSLGHEYPVRVRAMVVGDDAGRHAALVSAEVQGSFAAYQDGAFGWYDVAKAVEAATGGALPRSAIVISSDHSHRGADTTGVWGGLPPAYLQFIADQTRGAILDAYAARAPARLRVAQVDAGAFVTSDFSQPGQDAPDRMFRVIFVERPDGTVAGAYGTFSAHATLHGSARFLSPDWPGIVSDKLGAALGGVPVVLGQGAVGRTHPASDRATWEDRLTAALAAAYPSSSHVEVAGVDARQSAIALTAYNGILLAGLAAGKPGCAAGFGGFGSPSSPINPTCFPIARASTPPWQAGNRITTLVTAVRIGDVLVWGAPGEIYPNVQWMIEQHADASHVIVAGLANDQLGYLIAPSEDWHKIATTPTSDNTLFNVDVTGGDHVGCAVLDMARELGLAGGDITTGPARCLAWAGEPRTLPP